MSILIVIPCVNEEKNIERLVLQILDNDQDCQTRIVIADGGSIDYTSKIGHNLAEKYQNVTYLFNQKRLQSAAINLAVEKFAEDSEYLIRVDAHAEYPDDYCKTLVEEAKTTNADSVVVVMETQGINKFQKLVAAASNSKLGNGGSAHRSLGGAGCWVEHGHHALMRIAAFKKVNGYDEDFSHNEDAELDIRLQKAGFKIWLTDKTSIIYHPRSSASALFKQYFNYGHGRVRTILKHQIRPRLRQILPVAVAPSAFLAFLALLFSCLLLAIPFLLWAIMCIGYGIFIAKETADKSIASIGLIAMIMHMAWSLGFWDGLIKNTILKNQ
ncbi:MAG: glycosyltransferase family 2 protein [Rickettsiales bacterium]